MGKQNWKRYWIAFTKSVFKKTHSTLERTFSPWLPIKRYTRKWYINLQYAIFHSLFSFPFYDNIFITKTSRCALLFYCRVFELQLLDWLKQKRKRHWLTENLPSQNTESLSMHCSRFTMNLKIVTYFSSRIIQANEIFQQERVQPDQYYDIEHWNFVHTEDVYRIQ